MPTTEEWRDIAKEQLNLIDAREAAIEILSACASTGADGFLGIADDLDLGSFSPGASLAAEAWHRVASLYGWELGKSPHSDYYLICAEAEALLQNGWSPSLDDMFFTPEGFDD